jgi:TonB family protein
MKSLFPYLFLISLSISSCGTSNKSAQNSSRNQKELGYPISIDANNDGTFERIELSKEQVPQPVQGNAVWSNEFLKATSQGIKNRIEGEMLLNVIIDESGKVDLVTVKKSLSREIDEAVRKAYINSTLKGYTPLIINGTPTKFRIDIPVSFYTSTSRDF